MAMNGLRYVSGEYATQSDLATNAGLNLIVTQSFSAASSVSLNNCFTATYDRYVVRWSGGGSAAPGAACNMRLRSSGTDATGANYFMQRNQFYGSTAAAARATSQTSMLCGFWDSISTAIFSYEIHNPFVASANTLWLGTSGCNADTGNNAQLDGTYGSHGVTASYDGFTLLPASGTITGTVRVYGFRNS
jgi:hypothetical protein